MDNVKTHMVPASWQVTATTIDCDKIHEYVTIMVDQDWLSCCTGYMQCTKAKVDNPKRKFSNNTREQILKCNGPNCEKVTGYRDKLMEEEKANKLADET